MDAAPARSPYKGLMPYEETDADYFFGRTREIRLVIAHLFAAPATVVIGASGVGKSSILRAGVIPRLRIRADVVPVICSGWSDDPIRVLRRAVAHAVEPLAGPDPDPVDTLADDLRRQSRRTNRHLMVFLDQFEEFFLYHPPDHPFLDELADAVNASALNARHVGPAMGPATALGDIDASSEAVRALAARAVHRLDASDRALAFQIFRALLSGGGVIDPVTLGAGGGPVDGVMRVARELERAGLLRSISPERATTYSLAHDVLASVIREWLGRPDPADAAVDDWLASPIPPPTSYLLSLREDALARLDLFDGRIPDLMDRLLRIESLDLAGGREAIVAPLAVHNERRAPGAAAVDIEPALVDAVLQQVRRDRIIVSEYALGTRARDRPDHDRAQIETAFLQLVMTRLWETARQQGSPVMQRRMLEELNGAESIVRSHLDQVMGTLPEEDRRVASSVFRYLVTPSGTKIAHTVPDLADYAGEGREDVERVVLRLTSGSDRVLRPLPAAMERPDVPRYEIFHDRLGPAILRWLQQFDRREAVRQANLNANIPVSAVRVDRDAQEAGASAPASDGIALCLSGGGYRSMLFNAGAVWRLNELGLLPGLTQVSAVSAGAFVAGMLASRWQQLTFDGRGVASNLHDMVVDPLRALARKTIDAESVMRGVLFPGSAAERFAEHLRRELFGTRTLADLPESPRFVLVASNLKTGAVWRFSRPYMGDYVTGLVRRPTVTLAQAAASSAAVPPMLSPVRLEIDAATIERSAPATGGDTAGTHSVLLTDGSVLDRLAVETAWKRYRDILVSDGSGTLPVAEDIETDWNRQTRRVLDLVDWQARNSQRRQLIESFRNGARRGAYWGIASSIVSYDLVDVLAASLDRTTELAELPTRFKALDDEVQQRLINWGYAVCDAALRRHYVSDATPGVFPYPGGV